MAGPAFPSLSPQAVRCAAAENLFGPRIDPACYNGFDFTLLFEEGIMSIALSALVLLIAPIRIKQLLGRPEKAQDGSRYYFKLLGWAFVANASLGLSVLWSMHGATVTRATIPTSVLTAVAITLLAFLSHFEHKRTVRPSWLIEAYLLLATLTDLPRARTLFFQPDNKGLSILFSVLTVLRTALFVLEAWPKRSLLKLAYADADSETTAGLVSRSLFWWLNPLFIQGNKKDLDADELPAIDQDIAAQKSGGITLSQRWAQHLKSGQPGTLVGVCYRQYRAELLYSMLPRAAQIGFIFAQPFLISTTVIMVGSPANEYTRSSGYALIGAFALVYGGIAISTAVALHKVYRIISMMRDSFITMIYDKIFEMSPAGISEKSPTTLMSADIDRLAAGARYLNDFWAYCVEIAIALYLLYSELGVAGVAPIIVAVFCTLSALTFAGFSQSYQKDWLESIETRVGATSNMLHSMKMIKLRGLTKRLFNTIHELKEREITKSLRFRRLLVAATTFAFSNGPLTPVFCFALFSWGFHGVVTTNVAFYSLSLFAVLNEPVGGIVETAIGLATAYGSVARIEDFLRSETIDTGRQIEDSLPAIVAYNRSIGWEGDEKMALRNMEFKLAPKSFTFIVGPTGSGKTTLLNGILGETPAYRGYLGANTATMAYCAQEPWILNQSLRSNVLGTSLYDVNWYNQVLEACQLHIDCKKMEQGDATLLGSGGNALSGGQKQRVALARAIYSQKPIILLDNCFSGLDPTTEDSVMNKLFGPNGIFRQKEMTVVLTTNATHRLSSADHIIILSENGAIKEQGSFRELRKARSDFIESGAGSDNRNSQAEVKPAAEAEAKVEGFILPETAASVSRMGDFSLYTHYIKTVGIWNSLLFLVLMVLFAFFLTFPTVWVQMWSEENDKHPNSRLNMYLGVLIFLGLGAFFSFLAGAYHLVSTIVTIAARKFHGSLLETSLNAPMSFFSSGDLGTTINKFTQDLQLIDMELPISLLITTLTALNCLAQFVVIGYSTKYLSAIIPLLLVVFYFVQRFYLRTSRQLRYFEIETKSPLFSNILSTVSGLTTIRAFGWQQSFREENQKLVDSSQKSFYLLFAVQRWLELVVTLIVGGFAVVLSGIAVSQIGSSNAGFIGLALVNIVTFSSNIQQLIKQWTMLEQSLGAVARIRSFVAEAESEHKPHENREPPPQWPMEGRVEFRNVGASYKKDGSKPCLSGVNLTVGGGQKIAICGRSGSGKSSLVSSLLRLVDLTTGSILVDGVDLATLPRQTVREKMVVIPQEPYFYPGTVRDNLDPDRLSTDDEIMRVLEKTQMWSAVEKNGGLESDASNEAFSFGQRQLLCLANAMLRKGEKILVLDEATSGVDNETEELMQRIIRSDFARHTVFAVAHRLDGIMDFDQVLMLDAGVPLELGNPEQLLRTEQRDGKPSHFHTLHKSMRNGKRPTRLRQSVASPDKPLPHIPSRPLSYYAPSVNRNTFLNFNLANMSWYDDRETPRRNRFTIRSPSILASPSIFFRPSFLTSPSIFSPGVPKSPKMAKTPKTPKTPGNRRFVFSPSIFSPGVSKTPKTPKTPNTPSTRRFMFTPSIFSPGVPKTPKSPSVPKTPKSPGVPRTPRTPNTPGNRRFDFASGVPQTPKTPGYRHPYNWKRFP